LYVEIYLRPKEFKRYFYCNHQRRRIEMATLKRELQAVNSDIKAIQKRIEKLTQTFGNNQKAKTGRTVKKRNAPSRSAKKVSQKKAAGKKSDVKSTATQQVIRIIRRSKKGADVPSLKAKTGFDDKKVRNIIFRISKEGKIKKIGRGIYVSA
jgi:hypothetical protein